MLPEEFEYFFGCFHFSGSAVSAQGRTTAPGPNVLTVLDCHQSYCTAASAVLIVFAEHSIGFILFRYGAAMIMGYPVGNSVLSRRHILNVVDKPSAYTAFIWNDSVSGAVDSNNRDRPAGSFYLGNIQLSTAAIAAI